MPRVLHHACAFSLLAASDLLAQTALPAASAGRATPIRAIGVRSVSGRLIPVSDWVPISSARDAHNLTAAFDAFGGDSAGQPTGFCASGCTQNNWCPTLPESTRWWSGPNFRSPFSTNDMRPAGGTPGKPAIRSQIAWWWAHPIPAQCFVAILTGDNFSTCPAGIPPVSGNLGGVIIDFGDLSEHGGYWWSDIDLRGTSLSWHLPADGSYTIMLGTAYDSISDDFTLDPTWGTQPMQWDTGERPGSSGPMQWDDWRNANGTLEWNECGYYDDIVHCPRPQGAMAAFWIQSPCPVNCDESTVTPILTPNDFLCFLNAYAAANPSANCDASTGSPTLTANDFQCFINKFAAGCP
jgi:hypothetical protein